MRRRVAGALAADDGDTTFLLTGGGRRPGPPEAEVMAGLLAEAGVPADRMILETESRDTLESAVNCARLLAEQASPGDDLVVCTSGYHQPRCVLLLRMLGLPARAGRPLPDRPHMSLLRLAYATFREVPALGWDVLLFGVGLVTGRVRRVRLRPREMSM